MHPQALQFGASRERRQVNRGKLIRVEHERLTTDTSTQSTGTQSTQMNEWSRHTGNDSEKHKRGTSKEGSA